MSDPGEAEGGYIHPPDALDDDPEKNGLVCFLEQTRPCGADCMAFTPFVNEPKTTELSEQSRGCILLVNLERLGIHSVIGMSMLSKSLSDKKKALADITRAQQAQPPPDPIGGK